MGNFVRVQDGNPAAGVDDTAQRAMRAIEGSAPFQRAPVLRRLLLYLWEHREDSCSEYGIGVDVLNRRPDFDPKLDATVRVHVSRLRQKLRDYYLEEGETSQVRIVLPAGSHRLQLEKVAPPKQVTLVPVVNHQADWRPWAAAAVAAGGLMLVVIAILSVALWRTTRDANSVPELPAFWMHVLGNGKTTRIVFPTPIFVEAGRLRLRDVMVNDPDDISRSTALNPLIRTLAKTSISDHYSVTSDTLALATILKLLANRGMPVEVSATRDLSLDLFGSDNLLFLGIPPTSPHVEQLLSRTDFYMKHGGSVVGNRHPQTGEPSQFSENENGGNLTSYGIISVLPGRAPGTRLILVSGARTYALASFLTSSLTLADLDQFLRDKGRPEFFETVIEARVQGFKLLKARAAAFRSVPANLWK
jgi:hypothetical protein